MTSAATALLLESRLTLIMDELLHMLGLGDLSPAQLASVVGPEEMATLAQISSTRSLRAQAHPSTLSQGMCEQDKDLFIRGRKQDIKHAKEVLEASRRHLLASRS